MKIEVTFPESRQAVELLTFLTTIRDGLEHLSPVHTVTPDTLYRTLFEIIVAYKSTIDKGGSTRIRETRNPERIIKETNVSNDKTVVGTVDSKVIRDKVPLIPNETLRKQLDSILLSLRRWRLELESPSTIREHEAPESPEKGLIPSHKDSIESKFVFARKYAKNKRLKYKR